ncbi:FtsK/SpoIIIE domain-containing protein [Ornithinimicrobium cerasi]|uniref:DNA segregation ATPase FtsK/SpoIIIE, S-DNA-T family n=1 Tax=Ornithinimicrobium cerasi TaxID=2248773 RepID=A0A285VU46_9MICO|nr:FtsK/SpoIIIE domain-containing protein [Ornithinimicrobium cerasi]SOC57512.1 DNA segregation ATPase FtsK/SpoIIIE, S-DNA-T family [Ornithinimicrobium cerasi]SOC57579.1 DNA segregation ATPase FtsK/SpoIIIE, S-DNA-T family [Ornithinimicrobium cerasi]
MITVVVAQPDGPAAADHPHPHDLVVDAEDDATVGDLARALARHLPGPHRPAVPAARTGSHLRVVREGESPAATGVLTADADGDGDGDADADLPVPLLFAGPAPLDPAQPLASSRVRHGVLVGLGRPVEDLLAEPRGLVEVRVASGPGAGLVVRLTTGDHVVGTSAHASVRLPQIGLPEECLTLRVHPDGRVELTPGPEVGGILQQPVWRSRPLPGPIVLDAEAEIRERRAGESTYQELPPGTRVRSPDDAAPLVHVDREEVQPGQDWVAGEALAVGPCLLELVAPTAPDASLSPSPQGATLDFNRPPRLLPAARQTEFVLPTEPKRPLGQQIPWAFIFLPAVAGLAMFLITERAYVLIFIALTPLMAIANWFSGRSQERKRYKTDFAEYTLRMRKVQQSALEALAEERTARRRDFADPAEVLMTAIGPRARLWERRRTDPDWLVARFGTADQVSRVAVKAKEREEHEGDIVWTAPDVPGTVGLAEAGVTGVAGPRRRELARWVVAQLAVLHSPVDLDLTLLTAPDGEADWHWARWLPHLRSDDGDPELAQVGVDDETTARRIAELGAELERRLAQAGSSSFATSARTFDPVLVVLDGSRQLRLLPGMIPLLQHGPSVQMTFLCLDEDERLLPEECAAVVQADEPLMTVRVTERWVVEGVRPDLVSTAWAERVARAVSPVRDVSAQDAAASIPTASRLLDVLRLDPPTGAAVEDLWRQVGRTTTAVIGEGVEGPFAVDLVRDGPHGLVAGTTGSGKSELLQTVIASLAVRNRPDEMTFVLVDYKGGAAFKDCNRLPHTVGMVTDLDGHLTGRALESLGAELRRREHQLAAADAKDIEDYLAARGPGDAPMPRLLIVIDEFAALVAELPDFVTGLVDIARRGRSLGVHLILATQRPAGVVSAEIKSNTNLRIALRVTDANDSQDVIESRDAAEISKATPGRAYARLGHSSLIPFQSSRVGGRARGRGRTAQVRLRGMPFRELGVAPPAAAVAEEDASVPTDLAALVLACQEASESSGVQAPPSPWLPALEDVVTLEDVLAAHPHGIPSAERLVLPLGVVDLPAEQRRDVATYDLERGAHLAIIGASRSGRSTALRALAGAVARDLSPADVHVYGIDNGNNALLPLQAMPHVGAVVARDQTDRMERLVGRLRDLISARQQQLAEAGFADVTEQRAAVPEAERLPYVLILFDRWEGFFQAYDGLDGGRLVVAFQQILQEGAAVGVRVVMTGDRSLSLGRMATLLDDKLMLRMTDPGDFSTIGMPTKKVPDSMVEGRGFRADGLRETQVAILDADPSGTAQVRALQSLARASTARYADLPRSRRPFHVDVLPVRVDAAEAARLAAQEAAEGLVVAATALPVAVGGDTLGLRHLDAVDHGPGLLVTGARRTGRSTVLRQLATAALGRGWHVAIITPRASPLRELTGPGVCGPWDLSSDQTQVPAELTRLVADPTPLLVVVDDAELVGADGWLADALVRTLESMRDTDNLLVGAGNPADLQAHYRGPAAVLKKSGSGVMLAPQSSADADLFGARLNRSAYGQPMAPGGGYLVLSGQAARVQVIWPG